MSRVSVPLEEASCLHMRNGVRLIEIGFRSCPCDDCGKQKKLRDFIRNRSIHNDICNDCAKMREEAR